MSSERPVGKKRRWRLIFLVLLLLGAVAWLVRTRGGQPRVDPGSYVLLDVEGDYAEEAPEDFLGRWMGRGTMTLIDLVNVIRDAREDARVAGLVVRLRPLRIGWARAQDVRDALQAFRASGKPLVVYLEDEFAGSTREYYVASAAQKIYLPPGGNAPLSGLLAQSVFLGGVWEKLDIDMQVEKIAEYKTFGDLIANKRMSAAHREMTNSLLDSMYEQVIGGIADGRGLAPEAVRAAIDRAPATAEEFVDLGLADGAKFLEELRGELLGAKREFVKADDYRADGRSGRGGEAKIAVIYGVGTIHAGQGRGGGLQGETMGADSVAEAFRSATRDHDVKAIVFRIDSPGGSAMASDLIWHATQEARQAKPVIVSMSDVAGSGGYYVAAGATRILAQPGTLTGSIGVVMVKPNVSGFLAKLGITTETITRGELARLNSFMDSLTAAERLRVTAVMTRVYELFVSRVAAGRDLSADQVDGIGRGRVWTGVQAKSNGLVDELGGFTAAIDAAKAAAGVEQSTEVELVFYPKRKPLLQRLTRYLGAAGFTEVPPWWARIQEELIAYAFPEGSILMMMSERVDIR